MFLHGVIASNPTKVLMCIKSSSIKFYICVFYICVYSIRYTSLNIPFQPSKDLMNHILSVSRATSIEEDLIQTNVAGFIVVKSVDEDRGTMTIKSPAPHPLPGRFLLLSTLRYMDQS